MNGQPMAANPNFNQQTQTLTLEQIDAMINNPNEHPHIRTQMIELKAKLYPESVEVEEIPDKPKTTKKTAKKETKKPAKKVDDMVEKKVETKEVDVTNLEYRKVDPSIFSNMIQNKKMGLYNKEISLLSDGTVIHLRSMTVQEYKTLSKRYSIFENAINKGMDDKDIAIEEMELINTLDVILSNCITDEYSVHNMLVYDWIYALLWLRTISKGTEPRFIIRCPNTECGATIKRDIGSIIDDMEKNKDKFVKNPIGMVDFDDMRVMVSPLIRFDYNEITNKIRSGQSTYYDAELEMSVKAYVKDGQAFVLDPPQRSELYNILDLDALKKTEELYMNHKRDIFSSLGIFKCKECGKEVRSSVADFILFCYDI